MTTSAYTHPATGRVLMTNHTNSVVSHPENLEEARKLMEAEGLTVLETGALLSRKMKGGGR